MSKWTVIILPSVKKKLYKLQPKEQARIYKAIEKLQADPESCDLKPMKGSGEWRYRIGGWRLLVRVDKGKMAIIAVGFGARGDAYKH